MKIKLKEPHIPTKEEGGAFDNCELGREPYAKILTEIVENYADGFVLAINNEWGTGKTTFVKMWKQHLNNNSFKTLYFNAWENDFETNVLVALISELKELDESKGKKAFTAVVKKAVPLVKNIGMGIAKKQLEKVIDNDSLKEMLAITLDALDAELSKQIDNHKKRKESIEAFKESLKGFVEASASGKPVVFIIDELDRCRPNYAVQVLEQIKHLFSVPGIVFVLSIDKEQLGHAICGVYGSDKINADEYLRRFIDIEYSIPEPDTERWVNYLFKYFHFDVFFDRAKRMQAIDVEHETKSLLNLSISAFNKLNYSLRKQEKFFAHVKIILNTFMAHKQAFPSSLIFLMLVKQNKPDIYFNIKHLKYSYQKLVNEIEPLLNRFFSNNDSFYLVSAEAVILFLYANSCKKEEKYSNILEMVNGVNTRLSIKSNLDKNSNDEIYELISVLSKRNDTKQDNISYLLNRIDLIENLSS